MRKREVRKEQLYHMERTVLQIIYKQGWIRAGMVGKMSGCTTYWTQTIIKRLIKDGRLQKVGHFYKLTEFHI